MQLVGWRPWRLPWIDAPALVLALLAFSLCGRAAAQAKPCIAYRINGELRARCGEIDVALLRKPGLLSYAIGVDGGTVLGGEHWSGMVRNGHWAELSSSPKTWNGSISGSCGAALARQGEWGEATVDVITAKRVGFTSLDQPECSADRSLILGINAVGDLATSRGRTIAAKGTFYRFAVSPSGEWAAYIAQADPGTLPQLCIAKTADWSRRCFENGPDGSNAEYVDTGVESGGLSVNDAGEVLLVENHGGPCWYTANGVRVSKTKIPGGLADACAGVAVASVTSAPRVIIPLGFRPAWVDRSLLQAQFGAFKR